MCLESFHNFFRHCSLSIILTGNHSFVKHVINFINNSFCVSLSIFVKCVCHVAMHDNNADNVRSSAIPRFVYEIACRLVLSPE